MNLPAFCIRRPAFTIVISLVMMLVGVMGYVNSTVRWIPNVNPPIVTITTVYPGANAHLVEHDVTKVIESSLSGISGIESLISNSSQDQSRIVIVFKLGRDMNAAVEDVRGGLERVRGDLPRDVLNSSVTKSDPNSQAFMYITFYDAKRTSRELSDYVDKYITPTLETLDGVGGVAVYGKQVSSIQVRLDPAKMAGANVTVDDVTRLLQEQNASIPSGQIRAKDRFYSVITDMSLKSPDQFNDLIIRGTNAQTIRIKDIGNAQWEPESTDFVFRINGHPGIAIGIIPQSNANPLDVDKEVQKAFVNIKQTLPAGMNATIEYNQADYIRASIHSVYESLFEAILFVWLVILAFLFNFRATLIPLITIPVCLMSSFAIIYFMGFSINIITLMALVLAIGLVVDDAIVMLENISRHIESGMAPYEAALKGSREMIFPVIAMTITLACVYAPIAFTPGLLGVLFREFTFTLAGAVIISGIVALTLSPMMCARTLKPAAQMSRYNVWLEHQLLTLQHRYQYLLSYLIQKRRWVVSMLVLMAALGASMYYFLPRELAPAEDMNEVRVFVSAPRNASYAYTDQYVHQLEELYKRIPDIQTALTINYSAPLSYHILILKPNKERQRKTNELIAYLTDQTKTLSGVQVNVFPPQPPLAEVVGSEDNGSGVGLVLMTASDYTRLNTVSNSLMNEIKNTPGLIYSDNQLKWDSEQFQINIDRARTADLNISVPAITNTISTLMVGRQVGKTDDAKVFVRINKDDAANPNIFQQLYVRSDDNKMIPLASVLNVKGSTAPETYNHYNRLRSDMIFLSFVPTMKIGDIIQSLQQKAKSILPEDVRYEFTGEAKRYLDASNKTAYTFLLALVFIYLVLAAQFESFIDPLIIMLTVPFAVVGAMITLKVFGGSLNIYSNIGLITLIGLIAKHGILITEFANRLRYQGKSIHEAIVEAAILRLRPILMTTAAMVLGSLPLAFAFGPGAESRQQIGLVITGGMLIGTIFSLIIVPVMYTYLAPFRKLTIQPQETEYASAL